LIAGEVNDVRAVRRYPEVVAVLGANTSAKVGSKPTGRDIALSGRRLRVSDVILMACVIPPRGLCGGAVLVELVLS
jgi:hypothetical protein